MMTKTTSTVLQGLLVAMLATLYINVGSLTQVFRHGNTNAALEMSIIDADEARYMSRIRQAAVENFFIGNPSLKEHGQGIAPGGVAEWLTAIPMRVFGWDLATATLITDLLFPFIVIFLTWCWLYAIFEKPTYALVIICLLLADQWSAPGGLLRDTTPKITMIFASLYLCALFLPKVRTLRHDLLRGVLLGVLFSTYFYHWTWFFCFEGLLALWDWRSQRLSFWSFLTRGAVVFVPFGILALPYVLALHFLIPADVVATTAEHFSLIPTRFIVAPFLQLKVLLWLVPLAALVLTGIVKERRELLLFLLFVACLVVVNSNVITGKEAEFLGHFDRVFKLAWYPAVFICARALLPSKFLSRVLWVWVGAFVILFATIIPHFQWSSAMAAAQYNEKRELISWMDRLPQGKVIMAPFPLADIIPAVSSQYAFMTTGAHLFFAPEQELAERYAAHIFFFPENAESTAIGTMAVFGNYPGALYSKTRTEFQLRTFYQKPFPYTQADFISNQEHRRYIDAAIAHPDSKQVRSILSRYELDYLVTTHPVPAVFKKWFVLKKTIAPYNIYAFVGGE